MLKRFFTFISISIFCQALIAEDSVFIQTKVLDRIIPAQNFNNLIFDNPALHYYKYSSSLSTFTINGLYDYQQKAVIQEKGKGEKTFSINANSFLTFNEKSKLWGNAFYKNGKKQDVMGNETSDFDLIYPYVTADTIGGDIKAETYSFLGGYAYKHNKITYGAEFSYRSLLEYRDIDPRPRNIVADLNLKIGTAYDINPNYNIGLSIYYKRYKQNGDITFYNELGFSKIFHLNGLGIDYSRFAGKQTSYAYKGNNYGISISLLPKNKEGISATIDYSSFTYTKELTALNSLPLNELNTQQVRAELIWNKKINNKTTLAIKGKSEIKNKIGTENIFGSAANAYIKISSSEQFTSNNMLSSAEVLFQRQENKRFTWYLLPNTSINTKEDKYKDPHTIWEFSNLNYGTELGSIIIKDHNFTTLKLKINKQKNISEDLSFKNYESINYYQKIIQSNHHWLCADQWQLGLLLRNDFTIRSLKKQSLFVKGEWNYNLYDNNSMHTHMLIMSVGLNM